jgi:NAD-dependent dihydropyrimidine dehydrogenase PreA subunit
MIGIWIQRFVKNVKRPALSQISIKVSHNVRHVPKSMPKNMLRLGQRLIQKSISSVGKNMLYIDPNDCVDCGACLPVCPTEAIYYEDDLPKHLEHYKDINKNFFA